MAKPRDDDGTGATLLLCEPTAEAERQAFHLSFGLTGGEIVLVELDRRELSHLLVATIGVLARAGDEAAKSAGDAYLERLEEAGRVKGTALPTPAMGPKELAVSHRRRRRRPTPKPMARASGRYLKVHFPGEPVHRRLAVLGGWRVEAEAIDDQPGRIFDALLCRWKVIVGGRRRFRDFFVELPPPAKRTMANHGRAVVCLGRHVDGVTPALDHLTAMGDPRAASTRIAHLTLTRPKAGEDAFWNRVRYCTFRATEAASNWEPRFLR